MNIFLNQKSIIAAALIAAASLAHAQTATKPAPTGMNTAPDAAAQPMSSDDKNKVMRDKSTPEHAGKKHGSKAKSPAASASGAVDVAPPLSGDATNEMLRDKK